MSETAREEKRVTLELKICERCGGLWLRPAASRWVYCAGCKQKVSELPPATANLRKKKPRTVDVYEIACASALTERVQ
jgi:hypothetical protein